MLTLEVGYGNLPVISEFIKLVLRHVLAPKQQKLLKTWLIENTTGDVRIRAGTPSN